MFQHTAGRLLAGGERTPVHAIALLAELGFGLGERAQKALRTPQIFFNLAQHGDDRAIFCRSMPADRTGRQRGRGAAENQGLQCEHYEQRGKLGMRALHNACGPDQPPLGFPAGAAPGGVEPPNPRPSAKSRSASRAARRRRHSSARKMETNWRTADSRSLFTST